MIIIISLLLASSIYFAVYQLMYQANVPESHLPAQIIGETEKPGEQSLLIRRKTWTPLSGKYKNAEKRLHLPFDLKRKLLKAGSPIGVLEFLAFEVLTVCSVPVIALLICGERFPKANVLALGVVIGIIIPIWWLRAKINKRQSQMRKDLPNLIDLLNICVSGGLDFMMAVSRVIKDLKPCELTRELSEVYRETQMGATRREALKNFAWRIDMAEVSSFVRTLVQADRMGTSIADAMRMQSEEMRVKRFHQGEAAALKAPVKLLLPLFAFIMPTVLVIVAGPILLNFLRGNMKLGF